MKRLIATILSFFVILNLVSVNISAVPSYDGVFFKNPTKLKKVALTFDDGPHPRYTKQILEILKEYNITATFFIIGVNAETYPESLFAIAESGCEIANHSYSHKDMKLMNEQELKEEITRCENIIYDITGKKTSLFRPPEGACADQIRNTVKTLDYNMILWSIDTLDWAHNPSYKIAKDVFDNLQDGDIILMHDYTSGKNTTCDALKMIIPELLSQGYEFVTISELISE